MYIDGGQSMAISSPPPLLAHDSPSAVLIISSGRQGLKVAKEWLGQSFCLVVLF